MREDFVERELEGERLDEGGMSKVTVRVANFLTYTVLKILAFQDRHENKDAYDLVFTLLSAEDDPEEVGHVAHESAVAGHEQVRRRSSCSRNASLTSPRMDRTPTPAFSPAPEIKTRRRG